MFLKHIPEQTPTSWERNTNIRARLPIKLMRREKRTRAGAGVVAGGRDSFPRNWHSALDRAGLHV